MIRIPFLYSQVREGMGKPRLYTEAKQTAVAWRIRKSTPRWLGPQGQGQRDQRPLRERVSVQESAVKWEPLWGSL